VVRPLPPLELDPILYWVFGLFRMERLLLQLKSHARDSAAPSGSSAFSIGRHSSAKRDELACNAVLASDNHGDVILKCA
jgi:hypothetical protein